MQQRPQVTIIVIMSLFILWGTSVRAFGKGQTSRYSAFASLSDRSFLSLSTKRRAGGAADTGYPSHQKEQRQAYHRTAIIAHDTRRKRNPHYEANVSSKDGSGWDAWEFGQNPWVKGEDNYDPQTGKQRRKRKKASMMNEEDGEDGGEKPEEEEDLKEENSVNDIAAATACLSKFCTEKRLERLRGIVGKRTEHVTFVFENVANPNNLWACLRSLDAFGVQYIHVVADPEHYRKPHRLAQAKSAMGSQKWLSLTEHQTAKACVETLKAQGYRVLASDLKPGTSPTPLPEVDWAGHKVAIVMGNEERGITDEMRELCDGTFQIPMMGFAESFNLSVSTAVTLAFLSSFGGLKHGDLPEEAKEKLLLRWLIKSVPQGAAILRREGLLTEEMNQAPATIMGFKLK